METDGRTDITDCFTFPANAVDKNYYFYLSTHTFVLIIMQLMK